LTALYFLFFVGVLIKNVIWSVGDQTDVIRAGAAAFPLGLIVSVGYPGGRTGALLAVAICGLINCLLVFFFSRDAVEKRSRR
jgi:hypothetical protein